MLLCAGISFSLAVIDPVAVHLLSWAAVYIVWLVENRHQPNNSEDGLQAKPISLGQLCFAKFVNVKIILYGALRH